jgi:nucleotide-binding universal stress UspA family protein
MTNRYVVAYDGSDPARRALDHAVGHAKQSGAAIVLAHVLEWSPYSFLTAEELAERHKRRNEELERARAAVVQPAIKALAGSGVEIEADIRYGHVAETLVSIAEETGAAQIVIGRTGHSTMVSRLFGSVAGTLAQIAPVPVTIVP